MFCKKKKSRLETARHNVTEFVHDTLKDTLKHAPEKIGEVRGTVGDALGHVRDAVNADRFEDLKSGLHNAFSHVQGAVAAIEPKLESIHGALHKLQRNSDETRERLEDTRKQMERKT
jgi:phage-related minor tail protein